jgi:hypothetical protein
MLKFVCGIPLLNTSYLYHDMWTVQLYRVIFEKHINQGV